MLLSRRTFAVGCAVALCAGSARAGEIVSPVPGKRVALGGYDPVAYFAVGQATHGTPQYWYEFDDTVYLFANGQNRAAFMADPDHYAPQYRGFCAMSVSIGERDEGLPDVWEIVDGKLYVFGKTTGIQDFATDQAGFIARGKANWAATHPH